MNEQGVRNTLGNPMTFNSVEHLLKNRRYIGEFKYRDVVIPDGIPAIVPKELFDTFVNAIYLYDDKIVLTFNYHDGTKTITFDDVSAALSDKNNGSDSESSGVPKTL